MVLLLSFSFHRSFKHKHWHRICKSNLAILSCLTPRRPTHYSTASSLKSYAFLTTFHRNWNSLQLFYCQGVTLLSLDFPSSPFPAAHVTFLYITLLSGQAFQGFQAPRSLWLLQGQTWALGTEDDPSVSDSCKEQSSDLFSSAWKLSQL